ncbi:MAG: hypothetical protein JOY81_11780, partial [Alphaproteobacteria bacterium]|nr:hypothetical protein [Alphaproteobacteria bacterium]
LLTRNDGVFFCAAAGLLVLFASGRTYRRREMVLAGAVATVLVAPWLAYCQWVAGVPLPQSGLATSDAVRHVSHPDLTQMILNGSHLPTLFSGVRALPNAYPLAATVVAAVLVLALLAAVLRPRSTLVDRSSRLVLWAVAASSALLLLYYPLFSNAYQFYDRYLVPSKLLILILLAAVMLRFLESRRGHLQIVLGASAALAVFAAASNVYWTWRQFGLPYKGYFGREAYDLPRSPYVAPGTRLGMLETGRLGFLYPFQITNLDGKTNVAALDALRKRTLGDYINRQDFDFILLHDFDVLLLDREYPIWRRHYGEAGTLGELHVFKRKAS